MNDVRVAACVSRCNDESRARATHPRPVVGFGAMADILLPDRKWTRGIRWMWIVMVMLGIIVAIADGLRR